MVHPTNAARPEYLSKATLPFWVCMRLVALVALTASFAFWIAVSSTDCHQLSLVTVKYVTTTVVSERAGVVETGPTGQKSSIFEEDWTANIGVWMASASPDGDSHKYTTKKWLTGFKSNNDDLPTYKARIVLAHLSEAVEGLGPSMVLVPIAAALTGIYLVFQVLSFFVYAQPGLKKVSYHAPILGAVFTSHAAGVGLAAFIFIMSLITWSFELVLQVAVQDAAQGLVGLKVNSTQIGGAMIMTSIIVVLQLFVLFVQYQLFSKREMEDYQDEAKTEKGDVHPKRYSKQPPLSDMPIDKSFFEQRDVEEGSLDDKDPDKVELTESDMNHPSFDPFGEHAAKVEQGIPRTV